MVETLEEEASGLIQVPKLDKRVDDVGDHLNFRLVKASEEENLLFQVRKESWGERKSAGERETVGCNAVSAPRSPRPCRLAR